MKVTLISRPSLNRFGEWTVDSKNNYFGFLTIESNSQNKQRGHIVVRLSFMSLYVSAKKAFNSVDFPALTGPIKAILRG